MNNRIESESESARRIAYQTAAICEFLKLDTNVPVSLHKGCVSYIENFLTENVDMIGKVTTSHFIGMLITQSCINIAAANSGHYGMPNFKESVQFGRAYCVNHSIPLYVRNTVVNFNKTNAKA
jgi:hypothetical protein